MKPTLHLYIVVLTMQRIFEEEGYKGLYHNHIAQTAKLPAGVVHPILQRLVGEGFALREQEAGTKRTLGRYPRVYYKPTEQWADKVRWLGDDMTPGNIRRAKQHLGQ